MPHDTTIDLAQTVKHMCEAATMGRVEELHQLLGCFQYRAPPVVNALKEAARHGQTECVKTILSFDTGWIDTAMALAWAADGGHIDCLEALIPRSPSQQDKAAALLNAAVKGNTECVRMLLPHCDAKENDSMALQMAANSGRLECVELLIPVSDHHTFALYRAMSNAHLKCMNVLFPVSDPHQALSVLKRTSPSNVQQHLFVEQWICEQEHRAITQSLQIGPAPTAWPKKM